MLDASMTGSHLHDVPDMAPAHGEIPYAAEILLHQAALEGVESRGGPGGDADLGIEVLDVVVGGLGRDLEQAGRFLGRMPGRDQPQHLDLARRQARRALGRVPARRPDRRT